MISPPAEPFYLYWGKTAIDPRAPQQYHLLPYHCLDVAAAGLVLIQRDPHLFRLFAESTRLPEDAIVKFIPHFLALHDIGKFSVRFQNLKPDILSRLQGKTSDKGYIVRHDDMALSLIEQDLLHHSWEANWFRHDPSWTFSDWKFVWRPWFWAVGGHHGVPPQSRSEVNPARLFDAEDRAAACSFGDACAALFIGEEDSCPLAFYEDLIDIFVRTSWLMAGLVVLSDWIGSSDHFLFHSEPLPLREYWEKIALPTAERAVKEAGVLPSLVSPHTGMANLFPQITKPTVLQETVSRCRLHEGPQLFIMEETTGSGKTEAALVLAHRLIAEGAAEGIFIGLPTMATADAMYDRLGKAYQRIFAEGEHPSLILAHSARHLSDTFRRSIGPSGGDVRERYGREEATASAQCTAWLADSRKRALLASVGVGTIDQALMSVLPFRHQSLRLLGIARKVLIVDEVHAYDAYMHTLLEHLLRFHAALGGSAILLSATLPLHQRQSLIKNFTQGLGVTSPIAQNTSYPLLTNVSGQTFEEISVIDEKRPERCVRVELTDSIQDVEDCLKTAVVNGQCACWVRNTVKDALLAYEKLSEILSEEHVMLFHARFAMGDRRSIGDEVIRLFGINSTKKDRQGKVLIATQVVEQSLDLDFDVMVTDLAPIDLIIQRAGRLHRHQIPERGDRGTPTLLVLAPPPIDTPDKDWYERMFPAGAYVYQKHGQLWLTARILAKQGQIVMPGDEKPDGARCLIEGVFGPEAQATIPEALMKRDIVADGKARSSIAMANLNALDLDKGYAMTPGQWQEETRTPTRLDAPSVTVVLARWDGEVLRPWSDAGEFAWDMSQVSVRETMISGPSDQNGVLKEAIDRARETMPGRGVGRILVPLIRSEGECWEGMATVRKGDDIRVVSVIYDTRMGLREIHGR